MMITSYVSNVTLLVTERDRRTPKVEVEKGDPDDLADNHKQQLLVMKKVIESPFGEGSFEKLYEASGHSLMNMVDLLDYLVELVAEKVEQNKARATKAKEKYYSSKRKKK